MGRDPPLSPSVLRLWASGRAGHGGSDGAGGEGEGTAVTRSPGRRTEKTVGQTDSQPDRRSVGSDAAVKMGRQIWWPRTLMEVKTAAHVAGSHGCAFGQYIVVVQAHTQEFPGEGHRSFQGRDTGVSRGAPPGVSRGGAQEFPGEGTRSFQGRGPGGSRPARPGVSRGGARANRGLAFRLSSGYIFLPAFSGL